PSMSINMKKKSNVRSKRRTILEDDIPFQVKESFKTLRSNLVFALSTQQSKVIAVSSSLPSEGKSTIAANLAITFSQTDAKVLFIDADLRKPVQHKVFKLKNKVGLSTLLGGIHSFNEVINRQVIPGLDIVTSGPIPPNPSEMLASDNMKVLLDELSKYYDYIIIDTPPVNVVSDTLNMASYIAGVVMVARQGSTPKDALELALNAVDFADGHILGVVLSCVDPKTGKGQYKYKYKYEQK
ncbi:MAG: CpsD/CapB family tyrosine-protein kinase, partial [Oscillospiraceae bacterium]